MWDIQRDGLESFSAFLRECGAQMKGMHSMLLSGEDFENCVADTALARQVEDAAQRAGFEEVVWLLVLREPAEYVDSLYSELSVHNIVVNYDVLAQAALERGVYYATMENFSYIFILDHDRFIDGFRAAVRGRVIQYSFSDFLAPFVGSVIFEHILGTDGPDKLVSSGLPNAGRRNKRRSDFESEFWYATAFLGIRRGLRYRPIRVVYFVFLVPLVLIRWIGLRRSRAAYYR